jgi:hypothetical protein
VCATVGERLNIAPEIVEQLPAEQLNQIVDMREHTELVCTVCSGKIAPESDETVEVIALLGPARLLVIRYAHEQCKTSGVYELEDSPDEDAGDGGAGDGDAQTPSEGALLTWVPILRPEAAPRGVLVWEGSSILRVPGADGTWRDPHLDHMLAHGFVAADGALDTLGAPVTGQWSLRAEGPGRLSLVGPDGPLETFDDVEEVAPAGWVQALGDEERCLVVYGSQLGLERPDLERINAAIQASQTAVATVPYTRG